MPTSFACLLPLELFGIFFSFLHLLVPGLSWVTPFQIGQNKLIQGQPPSRVNFRRLIEVTPSESESLRLEQGPDSEFKFVASPLQPLADDPRKKEKNSKLTAIFNNYYQTRLQHFH